MVQNPPAMQRPGLDPWVGEIPWRREWLPTPIFLSGESHGQRSLVGYYPWSHKELDTTIKRTMEVNLSNIRNFREKAVAPHSSTLAWKIPWMEEPGRLQSMGLLRVGHD